MGRASFVARTIKSAWRAVRSLLPAAALCAATLLLTWAAFPPADLGFLAWVALLPWFILLGRERPLRAGVWSFLLGWIFFLLTIHWVRHVDAIGWVALSFYCGLYWGAAGLGIAWLRTRRVPVMLSAPLLIVALELLRARLLTGFPFIFLGHTQYRFLPIIQIADIAGVYGISFLVLLANAVLAEAARSLRTPAARVETDANLAKVGTNLRKVEDTSPRHCSKKLILTGAAVTIALVVATLAYGMKRLGDYKPGAEVNVLLVQANIPQRLKHSASYEDAEALLRDHIELTSQADAGADIILWPETMFPAPLNLVLDIPFIGKLLIYKAPDLPASQRAAKEKEVREYGAFLRRCREKLFDVARRAGAPMLLGAETADRETDRRFNSACLLSPEGTLLGRYDKMHLVIFGEYTPLADQLPFLRSFRPPEMGTDLSPGARRTVFDLPLKSGERARFGATICYEDTDADLFRCFVRDGAQFMVNLTNDGWFRDSSELDQHLAISAFRAVENRVSLARDANTGISAIIDPMGRMETLHQPDGRRREIKGTLTGKAPLSNLRSFYTAHGDLFAFAVLALSGLLLFAAALRRPAADEAGMLQAQGRLPS